MYSVLVFMSTRMLLQRGLKTKVNRTMFGITTFMYLLSAGYWVYSVLDFSSGPDPYVLSDGIVVWRAWVITLRSHRKYMYIPIIFLFLTAVSVLLTIAFRIANFDAARMSHVGGSTSLISNLSSMGVVGATLWKHWRTIRIAFPDKKQSTRVNDVLTLVVESGVLYCASAVADTATFLGHSDSITAR
ncbi:hypothetical protein B0H13DRAFT_2049494 [Mycena leptocephala]|nr:hypothetical protein B0H13DRAFT_2049494 [Mycena leptocephala]